MPKLAVRISLTLYALKAKPEQRRIGKIDSEIKANEKTEFVEAVVGLSRENWEEKTARKRGKIEREKRDERERQFRLVLFRQVFQEERKTCERRKVIIYRD